MPLEPPAPWPSFEAQAPQPPLEPSTPRLSADAPKPQTPLRPLRLPERVENAERQRRRTKPAKQGKRQDSAWTNRLSHRFDDALNNLHPSLAHDLGVLKRRRYEIVAAAAACAIGFGGAYLYRSTTVDRNKPVQISHAAPLPPKEPERTVEEKPKNPAVPVNRKLYYDRLPSETAEAPGEAPASPVAATPAPAATPAVTALTATASLAEPPKEPAPVAPEKTAQPAQAKPEGEQQPAIAPAPPAAAAADGLIADRPTWVRAERYLPDGTRTDTIRPAIAPRVASLGEGEARKPAVAPIVPEPLVADEVPGRVEIAAAAPAPVQAAMEPVSPAPAPSPAAGPGGYFAQVKSDQSRKAAEAELALVAEKYKAVLGELPLHTKSADLKDRGTWFRVLIGPVKSHDDADNLCKRLKGAGLQDCIVQKLD